MFQYSFCSYSTITRNHANQVYVVSIQLLFLFNVLSSISTESCNIVSIQLLFLFNTPRLSACACVFAVSIQLLFLFNRAEQGFLSIFFRFNTASVLIQLSQSKLVILHVSFNTASVLIQPVPPSSSQFLNFVSIQLLFLFNISKRKTVTCWHKFQYSFCSYSTGNPCKWVMVKR